MKISVIAITLSLLIIIDYASTLNILGIFPYQGKSHFIIFRIYLRELARRGHNVTVISHFPEENALQNYHDISMAGTAKPIEGETIFANSYKTLLLTSLYLSNTGTQNCDAMLENKQVHELIQKKTKFDVIVVEQFNSDCALGIAYKLQAPVVGIMSHILMPYHYKRLGIPNNPAYVPFHFLGGGTKPTLFQRVESVVFDCVFRFIYHFLCQRPNQNTLAKYFDDIPPLEDLARDIKFLLVYQNFILSGSRLFPANVIEVGGFHVAESKLLTGDIKTFVDEAEHGVIYISFGSLVNTKTMSADQIQTMLEVMKKLPQKFIWKWDDQTLVYDKTKLYTGSWLPQIDILAHRNTVAFVSHAGNGGTTEAIHFGVPMVAIPILGDQPANAAAIEESGLGVQLLIRDFTEENLLNALRRILDPKFRQKVKQVSSAWHDRPLPPLDTAIYWTEFAARHTNFTFRTAAADVPFYQHISLDVVTVLLVILTLVSYVFYKTIQLVCCRSAIKPSPNKTKTKKAKRS